jgi:hypothetical protein
LYSKKKRIKWKGLPRRNGKRAEINPELPQKWSDEPPRFNRMPPPINTGRGR